MKINTLAVYESTVLHLRDAHGDLLYSHGDQAKPVRVHVYGPGSKPFRASVTARQNRLLDRQQRKGGKIVLTDEQKAEDQTRHLCAITIRFDNIEHDAVPDGDQAKLARAIYSDPALGFIAQQVEEFSSDYGNFTESSATS